jgi:hypothetical protein
VEHVLHRGAAMHRVANRQHGRRSECEGVWRVDEDANAEERKQSVLIGYVLPGNTAYKHLGIRESDHAESGMRAPVSEYKPRNDVARRK